MLIQSPSIDVQSIQPLGEFVYVRRNTWATPVTDSDGRTAFCKGNIFVPDRPADQCNVVTILKVGPGCTEITEAHVGQRLVIPDNINGVHRVQGEEFLVRESAILGSQPYIVSDHA